MSEFEDRQDAAPAIDTPATGATAPFLIGPVRPETIPDTADSVAIEASASDEDDLDAVAAVEGSGDFARDELSDIPAADTVYAAGEASPDLSPAYPDISDAVATPARSEDALLDDTLEDGIASVFAALQAAARDGEIGLLEESSGPLSEGEATDGITFRLLGELDRLWHRAA